MPTLGSPHSKVHTQAALGLPVLCSWSGLCTCGFSFSLHQDRLSGLLLIQSIHGPQAPVSELQLSSGLKWAAPWPWPFWRGWAAFALGREELERGAAFSHLQAEGMVPELMHGVPSLLGLAETTPPLATIGTRPWPTSRPGDSQGGRTPSDQVW